MDGERGYVSLLGKIEVPIISRPLPFGTLEQRSELTRSALYALLGALNVKYVFYDVNLRQNYYTKEAAQKSLTYSNLLKLNEEEMIRVADLLYGARLSEQEFSSMLNTDYSFKAICITRGERGCFIYSRGKIKEVPGKRIKVIDTVGAGDAFSAAFIYRYCQNNDPFEAAELANDIGAYVASRRGAIPEYGAEMMALISPK